MPIKLSLVAAALLSLSLLTPTHAAPSAATVIIGGRTVPFLVTPFIGNDGQVYAPVDAVRLLGGQFTIGDNGVTATVTGANGHTLTLPCLLRDGHSCIALQKAATALSADAEWQPTTQTLSIRARLQMVRQSGSALAIYTSYPVAYSVQHIEKPSRIYVDLYGLDLASTPAAIPIVADDNQPGAVTRIRSGQMNYNTVRITLDLTQDAAFRVISGPQTNRVRVALAHDAASLPAVVAAQSPDTAASLPPLPVAPAPVHVVTNPPAPTLPAVPPSQGVRITSVNLAPADNGAMQVVVATTGPAKFRTETLNNPDRLAFDLAGATLDTGVNLNLPGTGPVVKSVRSGILHAPQTQFGRVVVDLARLVGFTVTSHAGDKGAMFYTLTLQTPRPYSPSAATSANSLSGKIIVVDPGHGAGDTGALGADGSQEKNFTLAIGRKLRDALAQNGATVYMTRDDDSKPEVNARPVFAIQHNADYFVSIHCDSSGAQNSHSGTTVYFHAQNPLCRRMAEDIVAREAAASGIPNDGVKSDTIRFATGFGVLRGSPMPAVLVECGYMNNDSDLAKLKDDATQQNIALGIVAGLRDFIADRAAR